MQFPISLASYSFHGILAEGRFDVFTYLEACRSRYGVDYADIWTGFLPGPDADFARKVRAGLDERSLGLANLCVDGPCVWVDDPDGRAANKKMMLDYIKAADIMGAKTIRIDFGGSDKPMSEEAFEWIVETYREYCGICAQLGMKIGPENHWGWDRVPEYLVRVRDAVASPAYGHLFHFGNFDPSNMERGTEEVIKYAMHTHIAANMIPKAKELIRRLAKSGYGGTYSVEHHSGEHELQRVGWQLGAVRSFIDELQAEGIDEPSRESFIIKG